MIRLHSSATLKSKEFTCISAVQTRAMRFLLGFGKYTPNAALLGEIGRSRLVLDNRHQLLPFGLVCLAPIHIYSDVAHGNDIQNNVPIENVNHTKMPLIPS